MAHQEFLRCAARLDISDDDMNAAGEAYEWYLEERAGLERSMLRWASWLNALRAPNKGLGSHQLTDVRVDYAQDFTIVAGDLLREHEDAFLERLFSLRGPDAEALEQAVRARFRSWKLQPDQLPAIRRYGDVGVDFVQCLETAGIDAKRPEIEAILENWERDLDRLLREMDAGQRDVFESRRARRREIEHLVTKRGWPAAQRELRELGERIADPSLAAARIRSLNLRTERAIAGMLEPLQGEAFLRACWAQSFSALEVGAEQGFQTVREAVRELRRIADDIFEEEAIILTHTLREPVVYRNDPDSYRAYPSRHEAFETALSQWKERLSQ